MSGGEYWVGEQKLLCEKGYALAVAYAGSSIVGFASAVCVTEQCFNEVSKALYEERNLTSRDVLPCGKNPYWYITSVCLLPQWVGKGWGTKLLASRCSLIAETTFGLEEITLMGQIWSQKGEAVIKRFLGEWIGPDSMGFTTTPRDLGHLSNALLNKNIY